MLKTPNPPIIKTSNTSLLKTKNIYIDTQAFVANNYFQSENLKRLSEFGKSGVVKIFMTEITRHEIIHNAANDLMNAIQDLNEFKKKFANKGKILKNIEEFKPYLDLPKIEFDSQLDKITIDLNSFLTEANIEFIPYHTADLTDIVTKYFEQSKPFGQGKKKHEFPDAIVLSSIEHWCKTSNQKIYMISGDNDMFETRSSTILTVKSLKDILSLINSQNDTDKRKYWIQSVFEKHEEVIKQVISEAFEEKLVNETGYDLELEDIEIDDLELHDYSTVLDKVKNGETVLQLDYDISFSARITYDDYSYAFFNKESNKPFGSTQNDVRKTFTFTQTAEITFQTTLDEKGYENAAKVFINCSYTSVPLAEDLIDKLDGYYYRPS
ncbi:DUF4935 domain-containing protein [Pedobacter steynii]|nr:DUF4935 domain-containing protein [Pedobacter steynii]